MSTRWVVGGLFVALLLQASAARGQVGSVNIAGTPCRDSTAEADAPGSREAFVNEKKDWAKGFMDGVYAVSGKGFWSNASVNGNYARLQDYCSQHTDMMLRDAMLALAVEDGVTIKPNNTPVRPPGVDLLDTGIAFTGSVTFERGEKDTSFVLHDHGALVIVKLSNDDAFSMTPKAALPGKWGHTLAQARTARIRFADVRDMPIGTEIRPDSFAEVFQCSISPQERNEKETFYALQCVALDKKIRPQSRTPDGLVLEAGIVVGAPNGSQGETFLSKTRTLIYARLE